MINLTTLAAKWTDDAGWPAQPFDVLDAGGFVRERVEDFKQAVRFYTPIILRGEW